jgi:hypothetical protein
MPKVVLPHRVIITIKFARRFDPPGEQVALDSALSSFEVAGKGIRRSGQNTPTLSLQEDSGTLTAGLYPVRSWVVTDMSASVKIKNSTPLTPLLPCNCCRLCFQSINRDAT